jgi:serine/threonine protein kinase/WD40 repeat protein
VSDGLADQTGMTIGYYKLLEKIGEGGFGAVYVAEQKEPLKRRVALKLIKLGMDTRQVVARFEAERQALAMMDHPNIARVLDAGATESGRPYFVMELVRGVAITRYCDENNLSTEKRLNLFIQICQAIQHAHQKGIIHRDIKPSNTLVTLRDGVPVPMVIDFGIAKATQQGELTDKTVYTQFQQFIGTPAYVSPEQAEMSGLDVDTRSDIYSLGVLLYELLVGKTPFETKQLLKAGLDTMRQVIREQEPARPSMRLGSLPQEEQTTTARRRGAEATKLIDLLRGDLDWIVMKCLAKDRTLRYDTANGLASDVDRFLHCEPVAARPPSTVYRVQRFVRRHRLAVATASAVAAALALGLVLSTWLLFKEKKALKNEAKSRMEATRALQLAETNGLREALERQRAEGALREARQASYMANIFAADAYLESHKIPEAQHALDTCEPDLRNWEWNHLRSRADTSILTINSGEFWAKFRLSPDGKWIAGALSTGSLKLWSADTGELKWVVPSLSSPSCVIFSDDSNLLAVGNEGSPPLALNLQPARIKVWRIAAPELVTEYELPRTEAVTSLALDIQGRFVLIGSGTWTNHLNSAWIAGKGRIRVCDLAASPSVRVLGEDEHKISFVSVASDGRTAITFTRWPNDPALWNLAAEPDLSMNGAKKLVNESAIKKAKVELGYGYGVLSVVPGKNQILELIARTNETAIVDRISGQILHRFGPLGGPENPAPGTWAMSPDANRMLISFSTRFEVWDLTTTNLLKTCVGHVNPIEYLTFSGDGRHALSSSVTEAKIWNLTNSEPVIKLKPFLSNGPHRWSEDAVLFYTKAQKLMMLTIEAGVISKWDSDSGLTMWDTGNGEHGISGRRIAASPHGDLAATFHGAGVQLWDVSGRKLVKLPKTEGADGICFSFSPDEQELLSVSKDALQLWDIKACTLRTNLYRPGTRSAIFSPDGRTIAAAGPGIELLNARSLQSLARMGQSYLPGLLVYAPGGLRIASVVHDSEILLWDVQTKRLSGRLGAGNSRVRVSALAFSPDGSRLASGGDDSIVRIWDTRNSALILTLRQREKPCSALAFSPDGSMLAAASADRSVTIWRAVLPPPRPGTVLPKLSKTAEELVEHLLERHLLATNVIQQLQDDHELDLEIKNEAIRLASLRDDRQTAVDLNGLSWSIVCRVDCDLPAYQLALRQARAACQIHHEAPYLNTLGLAYYRVDDFVNAFATLSEAYRLNNGLYNRGCDLLVMAMCQERLHQHQQAEQLLTEARTLMLKDKSPKLASFAHEAEQLIWPKGK